MAVNVIIVKTKNENSVNLLRKFSRKVRNTGVLRAVRKKRYHKRDESKFTRKKRALMRNIRSAQYERLRKLGKIS